MPKKILYPIRKIEPVQIGIVSGYNIQFELPNRELASVTLREDHPSWGYIERIPLNTSPTVLIGAFNHEWLHVGTKLHDVHRVHLPKHIDRTLVTVPLREPCYIKSVCQSGQQKLDLHFPFMNPDGSFHQLQIRLEDQKKGILHFIDDLDCPEIDLAIIQKNPLHGGTKDFYLLAARLPNRFRQHLTSSTT